MRPNFGYRIADVSTLVNLISTYPSTIPSHRLIELLRASLSYDRAYSDERKAWKKLTKERDSDSREHDSDDADDLNEIYCEVTTTLFLLEFF